MNADIDSQFSLLDARPLQEMSEVCEKYGIKLLTYGSFVSDLRTTLTRLSKADKERGTRLT